jgi:sugar (pentulose or hexulose) kinase
MQAGRSDAPMTVGIDLGTQSVRVTLLEGDGRIAASGSAPLSSSRSDKVRHEQDPEAWWEGVGRAAREATEDLGDREISGLSICSTSGTFLLADADGRPLTAAIMYNDGRAEEEARMAQEAGERVWSSLGYQMRSSFALPKLLWLLRSGDAEGARLMMHSADYIASRLAGEPVNTDWSHALKTGYDLVNERWPSEVLEQLKVPAEILPQVVRPGTVIGEVIESAAEHTKIPAGTSIRAGMTDSCAAQIAAGALEEGRWNSVLGTTLALKGVTRELLKDPNGVVYCHRHPDKGWLPGGASNTGAVAISTAFPDRDLDELGEKAERRGPATLAIYPLTTEGERFPFAATNARWFELGEPEDDVDRYRAVLEGVAFVERLCFACVESLGAKVSGPVALTGGGTKSRLWSQLRADVLGLPVTIPRSAEPSVGMAILARAGTGSVAEAAAQMSAVAEQFEPDKDRAERLAENCDRLMTAFVERGYISESLARRARMS